MKIHLHCIAFNEQALLPRFLDTFRPHVDSITIVRATGTAEQDATIALAAEAGCTVGEYLNSAANFPHADNFAAARNVALDLSMEINACGEESWLMWADLDDVLTHEAAAALDQIRAGNEPPQAAITAPYITEASGKVAIRTRLVRASHGARWVSAVHEDLQLQRGTETAHCPELRFVHMPPVTKTGSCARNRRILEAVPPDQRSPLEWWYLMREQERGGDIAEAIKSALAATANPGLTPEQAAHAYLVVGRNLRNPEAAEPPLLEALRLLPDRREPCYELARLHVQRGDPQKALSWSRLMEAQPIPEHPDWSHDPGLGGWKAHELRSITLHKAGKPADAQRVRDAWQRRNKPRIAVGHPTVRPERAIHVREMYLTRAWDPDRIAYFFGVNESDPEVIEGIDGYPHTISAAVPAGYASAVANYNAAAQAAAMAAPVVLMSQDDIYPPYGWDQMILQHFEDRLIAPRRDARVLHLHDGHRDPANCRLMVLMCFTHAWYAKHLELLSPEYDGYWSDTEYSWRTYNRNEVIPAGHIKFWHDHPLFTGAKTDAEYWRQQNPAAEARGRAIFARRNPDAVAEGW